MKRTPLKRKTPLRANPETTKQWKARSKQRLPSHKKSRKSEEIVYLTGRRSFLEEHPVCPVTGERTTDIHHSAKRVSKWLNLRRYWIALSRAGHDWVEKNGDEAELHSLVIRLNPSITYDDHMKFLQDEGISPDEPLFYKSVWRGPTGPILQTSYARRTT